MRKVIELTNETIANPNDLVVLIDGEKAKDSNGYLEQVFLKMNFPEAEYINWDAYIDWMRDLSWIKNQKIYLIITDWNDFLSEDTKINKSLFIEDFNEDIFKYWEKENDVNSAEQSNKDLYVYFTKDNYESVIAKYGLINRDIAIYLAQKYMRRNYNMDVIGGTELDEEFIFTGGNFKYPTVGNPRIKLDKLTCKIVPVNFTIKELMNFYA